uniref:CSON004728 protein n=1 Tax=Culicoides sonorensis TaxID=179676 RepID=A0A336LUJ0_CULSO
MWFSNLRSILWILVNFILLQCNSENIFDDLINGATKGFMDGWVTKYSIDKPLPSYDYIIIGAGPAGCVIANRLSEDPNVTVLLIEAGKSEIPLLTDIPMIVPNLQSTSFNFNYTPPAGQKKGCLAMNNQQCWWPHGKGLGGSSLINYMIYTRGNRRDYDSWKEMGNSGWGFDEMLPLFKKIEKFNVEGVENESDEGNVSIEDVPFRSSISSAFVEGAQELGHKYLNYNGEEQLGVSYLQQSTKNGWRVTSTKAYLDQIKTRPNLHILTDSWASKILIDSKSMRAIGVHYIRDGKLNKVKVKRELILSAGAFESPKLLMLSGIGPRKDLEELKINVIKDLPVGKTLYEHVGVLGPIYIIRNSSDNLNNLDSVANFPSMIDWALGQGPLTSNGIEALLYMKTNFSQESDPLYPDIEVMQSFTSLAFDKGPGTRRGLNLRDDIYKEIFEPIENCRTFQYVPLLLQPRTKGSMLLKSKNLFKKPFFNYTFFEEDDDVSALVEAIKEAIRITNSESFKNLQPDLYTPTLPFCPDIEKGSDKYWDCYVRHFTATLHHQIATTKMGPKSDNEAVVDQRLKVHGFENLRVADIGIIPKPPTGHTTSYSYVIGEKASQMILEDSELQRNALRRKREITKRKYFDWQKNPDLSSEESTEIESEESMEDLKTNITLMDIILARNNQSTTESSTKSDLVTILSPVPNVRTTKLQQLNGHHHRHNRQHRVKSHHVMTFADSVNDDGHLNVSHVAAIIEQEPAADEDHIKVVESKNGTVYGKGSNKPKAITAKLHEANSTVFNETEANSNKNVTNEFVVISVGKSENVTEIKLNETDEHVRVKRQTLNLQTIQDLQQALELARYATERWERFTRKTNEFKTYFKQLLGLPDLDSITVAPVSRNKRSEKDSKEIDLEELKNQTMEFIDKERHESDKEKEVVFTKVKKNNKQ